MKKIGLFDRLFKKVPETHNAKIVIRRVTVVQYHGIAEAARAVGVSETQVRRHVSGQEPSKVLERKFEKSGIIVEA